MLKLNLYRVCAIIIQNFNHVFHNCCNLIITPINPPPLLLPLRIQRFPGGRVIPCKWYSKKHYTVQMNRPSNTSQYMFMYFLYVNYLLFDHMRLARSSFAAAVLHPFHLWYCQMQWSQKTLSLSYPTIEKRESHCSAALSVKDESVLDGLKTFDIAASPPP